MPSKPRSRSRAPRRAAPSAPTPTVSLHIPSSPRADTPPVVDIDRRTQLGRVGELFDDIAQRIGPHAPHMRVVRRDLARYYEMVADARARLLQELTPAEWATVRGALAGMTMPSSREVRMIWAHVMTHLDPAGTQDMLAHPLVQRLRSAPLGELWALVDALESWPTPDGDAPSAPGAPPVSAPAAVSGP
jgi:hypothetical protein